MSNALTHLYRFSEIGFRDPFSRNNSLYFILDKSGSMGEFVLGSRTRFDISRQQLIDVLLKLLSIKLDNGIEIDVGVCVFSSSSTEDLIKRSIDETKVDALITFLNSFSPSGGTPYNTPLAKASDFYSFSTPGYRRACFFITDGIPVPEDSVDTALAQSGDLIGRKGRFSKDNDNDVDIYGIAVDLFDVVQLGRIDNTPRDGIQSISSEASSGLSNALLAATYKENIVYNFTDAPFNVEYGGETYIPAPISMGEVEVKEDIAKSSLDITLGINNVAAQRWISDSSESIINATVWLKDEMDDIYVIWKGRLSGKKPSGSKVELSLESVYTSLARSGLGARYQRMCRHGLYGRGCGVNKNDHVVSGIPSDVSGAVVTISEASDYSNGWFIGGMLETPDGSLRFIVDHVGDKIYLALAMDSLSRLFANQGYGLSYGLIYGGLSIKLYPGCNRSRSICNSKFNNIENYGGFDWIPTRNPFDGNAIN